MSLLSKALTYAAGIVTVGGVLFFAVTPSANSDFQEKIKESQGALKSDMSDSRKQTQMLMSKLRNEAGIKPEDKS